MNWEIVKGNWEQTKGTVRQKWGKLTNDDVQVIKGERDKLVGKLRERYGYEKDEAEKQVDTWVSGL
jgi:uncharacterized protein YjbJ (UPF0337 family)